MRSVASSRSSTDRVTTRPSTGAIGRAGFMAGTAVAAIGAGVLVDVDRHYVVASSLLVLVIAAAGTVLIAVRDGGVRPLSFGFVTVALLGFAAIHPPVRVVTGQLTYHERNLGPILYRGSLLTAVALVAFVVGYLVHSAPPRPPNQPIGPDRRIVRAIGFAGVVLYSGYLLLSGRGITSGLDVLQGLGVTEVSRGGGGLEIDYLKTGILALIAAAALQVSGLVWHGRRRAAIAWTVGWSAFFLLFGFRYRVVIFLLAIGVVVVRGRRPVRITLAKLSSVVVAGLIVFPYVGLLRRGDPDARADSADLIVRTFDISATNALVVDGVPSERLPFLFGESYVPVITQWVPSAFWPGKPRTPTIDYQDSLTAEGVGAALSLWGEVYINFGHVGVAIVFCLLGWVARSLDRRMWARKDWLGLGLFGLGVGLWAHVLTRGNLVQQVGITVMLIGVPYAVARLTIRLTAAPRASPASRVRARAGAPVGR